MKSFVENSLVIAFLILLLLPGVQMIRPLVSEEKLYGVEAPAKRLLPEISLRNFYTETFQKNFVAWLNEHFGFRGHLVRTDNQLNFSLFREISANYGSRIIVGKEDHLYEKLYIDSANGVHKVHPDRMQFAARQLLRLQTALNAQGKTFLVIITPSKATVYPEYVPRRFVRDPNFSASEKSMNDFVEIIRMKKINVFDTRGLLKRWKSESSFKLFAKGGTHWTEFVACRVGLELMQRLRELSGRNLRLPLCEPVVVQSELSAFDRDLADLTNLWSEAAFRDSLPYVDLAGFRPQEGEQPKMFFVGGSFLWAMLAHFERQSVYASREFFYYYEKRFRWPENTERKIRKADINWKAEILPNEIFVLEINEAYLHHAGMGFVRDAVRNLRPPIKRGQE